MRRLLPTVVVAGVLVSASCSSDDAGGRSEARVATTRPVETTSTTRVLPPPARYQPVAGEPVPEVKQLAADTLQRIGTYAGGGGTPDEARRRLADLAASPQVADQAGPLLTPSSSSSVEIVYPQLGGLTDTDASVMVVVRQRLLPIGGAAESVVTRTVDVRLTGGTGRWSVAQIASTGGSAVEPVALSPAAQAVLASDAIDLPDSARWDIQAGRIDDRVLQLLADLTAGHTLSVTVLSTGHPANVFETESVSNHTQGRGVDIWAVDGQPVVAHRDPAGPARTLVTDVLARGVTELGSPWDLDGPTGASFTNTVHQDHLHLAFDGP